MSRLVVIHQPDFLPYLGFFHRFLLADIYVVLDHVQFSIRNWTHRDKIKTRNGATWLTLGIRKTPRDTPINEVMLSGTSGWRDDHLNLLRENYRDAPHFDEVWPRVAKLYECPAERLIDFSIASIDMLGEMLDVHIERVYSSTLAPREHKSALMANLVQAAGGDGYLSGVGAREYFDPRPFEERDIAVTWQNFAHPVYPQLHGEFVPYLSALDAMFNCGIQGSRELLRRSR